MFAVQVGEVNLLPQRQLVVKQQVVSKIKFPLSDLRGKIVGRTIVCRILSAFFIALVGLPNYGAFALPPNVNYTLAWNDEFSGVSIDTSKWYVYTNPWRNAINTTDAMSVADGNLTITTYTSPDGTHYTGYMKTKDLHCFGYYEARINFNDAPGIWSAFWLYASGDPGMGNPIIGDVAVTGNEVDIVEHRKVDGSGSDISGRIQNAFHWDGYGDYHKSITKLTNDLGLSEGFHTYGVEWKPDGYNLYIDNMLQWEVTRTDIVSFRPQEIRVSSEIQNNSWAGVIPEEGYGSLNDSEVKMVIDYVRFYTIPEPGALCMLLAGAVSMVAYSRRRTADGRL